MSASASGRACATGSSIASCSRFGLTVADLSNDIRPVVGMSLAHVAARQELRNLMLSLGLDDALAPLDAAA